MLAKSRPLDESEFYFVSKEAMEFVQLCIKLKSPEKIENYVNQVRQSIAGLYSKCDRKYLYNVDRKPNEIEIHKIPNYLKSYDLQDVNQWMYENHTPDIHDHLAEIAANDTMLVINSSHVCADGGYLASIVKNIQSRNGLPPHPTVPGSIIELLKDHFDSVQSQNKEVKLFQSDQVTYLLNLKENPDVLETSKAHSLFKILKAKELSCFNQSNAKLQGLTDMMYCGLSLSLSAKNNKLGALGCNTCVDFRKVIPSQKVSKEMTNFFSTINIVSANMSNPSNKNLTIGDISKLFRDNFTMLMKDNALFYSHLHPVDMHRDNTPFAHLSNIGVIKILDNSPIEDFAIRLQVNQKAAQEVFQIVSYSKVSKGRNDVHFQCAYSPKIISDHDAKVIFDSFVYFMKNINIDTKVVDAYNSMKKIQSKIKEISK